MEVPANRVGTNKAARLSTYALGMPVGEEILARAVAYLREEVAPHAEAIDRGPSALRTALNGLAERGLMALKRPAEYGGPGLDEPLFRKFQEEVARTSGSLAFLQTQHQSAVAMLARSDNEALKQKYLPQMADGGRYVGIGFSQLRRPGSPIMRAERCDEGYRLNGEVPWVTGWDFYEEFLIGAQLPSGEAVFGPVPLREGSGISVSEPMRLAAMESANTVAVTLDDYLLRDEDVAFIRPAGWIRNNDQINIALQGHFAIGCAQAGIDVVRRAAEKRGATFLFEAAEALQAELEDCRQATTSAQVATDEESTEERLQVRSTWRSDVPTRG